MRVFGLISIILLFAAMLEPAAGAGIVGTILFTGISVSDVSVNPEVVGASPGYIKINYTTSMLMADNKCDVDIVITNQSYQIVRMIRLTDQSLGKHSTSWDGKDDDGNPLPDGTYRINVTAKYTGYKYERQWGSKGTGDGQFDRPMGIAVDRYGNVYVADTGNSRIQKFDTSGYFITKWGSRGTGNGQFQGPYGVAVYANSMTEGYVYVTEPDAGRVQRFESDGTYMRQWGNDSIDSAEFEPWGIAAVYDKGQERVFVSDAANVCIHKFDTQGNQVLHWGSIGTGNSQFHNPIGIAGDGGTYLYTVDAESDRVQKFNTNGGFIAKWGSPGTGIGQCNVSTSAAAGLSDSVFVVDAGNNRIQKFNTQGSYITQFGSKGTGNGRFDMPVGIAADNYGNVYVTDSGNHRVQKFVPDVMVGHNSTTIEVNRAATPTAAPSPSTATGPTAPGYTVTPEPAGEGTQTPSSSAVDQPSSTPVAGEPTASEPGASATAAPSGTAAPSAVANDTTIYLIGGLVVLILVLVLAVGLMGGYIFGKKK